MSIKRKFATAVATASLLAGLFGSALVSTASAARIGGSGDASASKSIIADWGSNLDITVASDPDELGKEQGPKDFFWSLDGDASTDLHDNSYVEYQINDKGNDDVNRVGELTAKSSSSLIKVAWLLDNDGSAPGAYECDAANDLAGNTITSTDTVEGAEAVSGDEYVLCIYSNGKAGKATVTVTADGVSLPSFTVTTFGTLASLTLAVRNGHNYVAEDNDAVASYFTIVGKDSAGQVLNGAGSGAYYNNNLSDRGSLDAFSIALAEDNPMMADDEDGDFLGSLTDFDALICGVDDTCGTDEDDLNLSFFEAGFSLNRYALASDLCGAGDAGKSYSFAVEGTEYAIGGDTITSNTVSITCTGNEAKVTDLSVEATGGARKYNETGIYQNDELSILATIVDQANRPMGVGVTVNFDVSIDGDSSLDETAIGDIDFVGATYNGAPLGNKVRVGYLEPDVSLKAVYPYSVTLANSDLGADDEVVYSEDFTYTVDASAVEKTYTISVVKNAAKTRATMTVNFGASCSRQMVDFDVELANGDVKYLTRRADINGVAKLTMERRNTKIYVTAFCGGDPITGYDLESSLRGVRFR